MVPSQGGGAGAGTAEAPALLPRVAAGEPGAADDCMQAYGGLVWTIARSMLGNGPDAEDAVQDVFIELWRSADRFDPSKGRESTFVSVIARRRVVDRVRKRQRSPVLEPLPERLDAGGEDVGTRAEIADEFARAEAALGQLPEERQRVLRLALLSGASHSQVATRTGLPLGTVKTHVRRGLMRLREMLAEDGDDDAG